MSFNLEDLKNDTVSLAGITYQILGSRYFLGFYNYFKSFFMDLADRNNKNDDSKRSEEETQHTYVAFITRRCSCLAYIFLRILCENEEKCRKIFEDNANPNRDVVYLTDCSLINKGWEIGQLLLEGKKNIPKIILADDAVSYGRTVTNIMGRFEEQVMKSIESASNELLQKAAKQSFGSYKQRNIVIRSYAQKKQTNLLKPQDAEIFQSEVEIPHYQWNDLSNRISELMTNIDMANTSFVFSRGIAEEENRPDQWNSDDWKKVDRVYRDHRTFMFYSPVSVGHRRYGGICTVRCVECGVNDSYRLIPFIFLPSMSADQLEILEKGIFDKLKYSEKAENEKEDQTTDEKCGMEYDTFDKWKEKELNHVTLQSRFDFVTMYLSFSAMKIFEEENGIVTGEKDCYDSEKILWNYSDTDMRYRTAERLISEPEADILFSREEIWTILKSLQAEDEDNVFYFSAEPESRKIQADQKTDQEKKRRDLDRYLENYLFELAIGNEKASHEAILSKSKLGQYTLAGLQKRKYHPMNVFFSDLYGRIREDKRLICSGYELLSSILQLADAGLISVVSEYIDDEEAKYRVMQEVKICEQAPAALMRRYLDHTDIMMMLERSINFRSEEIVPYLEKYCIRLKEKDTAGQYKEEPEEMAETMAFCIRLLKRAGQKFSYWTVGLKRHYVSDKEKGGIRRDQDDLEIRNQRSFCADVLYSMRTGE